MKLRILKIEVVLRIFAVLTLALTSCLLGFVTQTKTIVFIKKHITYKNLEALSFLVYVGAVASVYNLLQLSKCYFLASYKGNLKGSYRYLAWGCYLLDQIAVYMIFAATSAALGGSLLAVTGEEPFQWIKWCDKFTRFCTQVGVALIFGYFASAIMAFISFISAFRLFSLYSPRHFLHLKTTAFS